MSKANPNGPLDGIRVVDWTLYGVGPFAGALLGALGADVIKVEAPPRGDAQQYIPPTINGIASLYINFNTSKRGIHLDLKNEADRKQMWRLIESSDVLLINFRRGVPARLGFGYDDVRKHNPNLVYIHSTGWGEVGPMRDQGGGDTWNQVFSGFCSINGQEGGRWEELRFKGHLDLNSSSYIAAAILTGLYARDRLGACQIDIDMLSSALAMQTTRLAEYLLGGEVPLPLGSAYGVVAPNQAFECEDGRYVAASAETESQWARLCAALKRDDLRDKAEYGTNADRVRHRRELALELGSAFKTMPSLWWTKQLTRAKVPNTTSWDWDLIRFHPQVTANEHIVEIDTGRCGVVYTNGAPWKFTRSQALVTRNPFTGENTEEVLAELDSAPSHAQPRIEPKPDADVARPLAGIKVLELANGIAGPYCGSLFADGGAVVTKLEPAGGDYLRGWGPPFLDGEGVAFAHLNRRKQLETLRPKDLEMLVAESDVVLIDAFDPDGAPPPMSAEQVAALNPEAVVVSFSPYGETGPLTGVPGSELTVQAMCNVFAGLGRRQDAPVRIGADQASVDAGVMGYQGALAALIERARSGLGQKVSVSLLGALHAIKGMHWTSLSNPDQWPGLHLDVWTAPPDHGYATANAPILFGLSGRSSIEGPKEGVAGLMARLGSALPDDMDPPDTTASGSPRQPSHPRWQDFWEGVFEHFTWQELDRIFTEEGGQICPWLDYPGLDAHPQTAALGSFVEEDYRGRRVRFVRVPWQLLPAAETKRATATAVEH
jgi:crotonobetainyl-CoA:carnitine CoA-transferase CaiB-like acyl-CoA transferase